METTEAIRRRIKKVPAGEPFTSAIFLDVGTRASVDQALSRLVKSAVITRVTRGVFVRSTENRYLGKVLPAPGEVAEALAKAKGASLQMHGAEAARRLDLTTQTPTQTVFYTTGPSKRFRVGKLQVVLKHTASRKLTLAGRPAGIALSALWYLGKGQVTPETIAHVRRKLPLSEFKALSEVKASMPGWMADAFYRHEKAVEAVGDV